MTTITIFEDVDGNYSGFEFDGHAEAAKAGEDIVCASLSILAINTVNSVEKFAVPEGSFEEQASQKSGYIKFLLKQPNHDSNLLIDAMILGVEGIAQQYPRYVRLKRKGGVTDDRT
ncbi:MAG: ribosomal-processing cysteine protease Prp [Lachnospiraceae bacterium]|nr:ribosomal-processing cysteine protease Prp [Lachnospiraceae bacterium]